MNDKSDSSYSQRLAPGDSESPTWSSEDDLSRNRAYDSRGEQQSSLRFAALQSYGLAFLSVAIAVGSALLLESPHFRDAAVPLLLFAVAITSWYSRTGPGVVAVVLSTISFYWYVVEPVRTPYIYPSQIIYFVEFVAFASLISWFATIRRHAEGVLQEQANLLNLTHDSIFVIDMNGEIKYWNRGAEERYGWTADQVQGKNVDDLLKTVLPAPVEKIKAEVARTGQWKGEILHTRKDGSKVVVASRWSLQRDKHGAPLAIMETNNDITERKQAEEALRRSEGYLAEAERLTRTGSWVDDGTVRPVYWSEEHYRIFGLDPRQGLPTRDQPLERIHPDDRDKVLQAFERVIHQKTDSEAEYRIVLPDGTLKYAHSIGHPVLNANGDLVEIVGTTVDITERKRTEQALRRSEAYLTEAQRLTHTGSWAGAGSLQALYWSEEHYRIFGLDPQQGLPTRVQPLERVHPEDLDKLLQAFSRIIDQRVDSEVEYRIVLPDGAVKWIHAIGHPVLSTNEELVEVIGTTVDITGRKRAEEERARLHRLENDLAHINRVSIMGELTASIAHEVNQPLSGVVSNGSACLRWLAGETPNIGEARETARRIVRDGKRAAEIIGRIRALTKRTATPREKLDLNEAILEILPLVGDEAKKKSVIIRTCFGNHVFPVLGDRVQLQQVVLNLVMNGIEAMNTVTERARELVITIRNTDPDQVEVTVEDSGTGLDPDASGRIFEAFFTTKPAGMGMGLSICRSILQAHNGRLWATANHGVGTTLHFTLPKEQEEANAEPARV
ncbi:MAG: PAS domain-containing protein [Terracidiphilus sp.]